MGGRTKRRNREIFGEVTVRIPQPIAKKARLNEGYSLALSLGETGPLTRLLKAWGHRDLPRSGSPYLAPGIRGRAGVPLIAPADVAIVSPPV